jgi:hypothetical protein
MLVLPTPALTPYADGWTPPAGPTIEVGNVARNIFTATRSWFVDPTTQNRHLATGTGPAIDTAVPIEDVMEDFDRIPRPQGRGPDVGAFEFRPPARTP